MSTGLYYLVQCGSGGAEHFIDQSPVLELLQNHVMAHATRNGEGQFHIEGGGTILRYTVSEWHRQTCYYTIRRYGISKKAFMDNYQTMPIAFTPSQPK